MRLPDGYSVRPLAMTDVHAAYEVIAAQQQADVGEVVVDEADVVADWQRPSFDVGTNTIGVLADDAAGHQSLVAYAEVSGGDRGDAAVRPDHRGRGVGTWLAGWMQERARERGATVIGMPVLLDSAADRLLAALGYRVRWTSWVLELPAGTAVPDRALPDGYRIRVAAPTDHRDCWTVLEDAFLEWSQREREPYADFLAEVVERPGFEPWQLRLVTDVDAAVVAVAAVAVSTDGERRSAFVERLATRRDQRGRGLAQALLVDCFAVARSHGVPGAGLSTDSRTGALSLYEKVGMAVTSTWVNRAIDLS